MSRDIAAEARIAAWLQREVDECKELAADANLSPTVRNGARMMATCYEMAIGAIQRGAHTAEATEPQPASPEEAAAFAARANCQWIVIGGKKRLICW